MPTMGKSICHVSKIQLIQVRDVLNNMIENYQEDKRDDWKEVEGIGQFPDDVKKNIVSLEYPYPDVYPDVSWGVDDDKKEKWDGSDIY